ncbi:hypothetical protein C8Q79DRAFT_883655, partial [Trametes meyenii]
DSSDWSCGYDALFTILWNVRVDNGDVWLRTLSAAGQLAGTLVDSLVLLDISAPMLERVRDAMRDTLASHYPAEFPRRGHALTSVSDLVFRLFTHVRTYGSSKACCGACGFSAVQRTDLTGTLLWTVMPELTRRLYVQGHETTSQNVIDLMLSSTCVVRCTACREDVIVRTELFNAPPLVVLDVSTGADVIPNTSLTIPVNGSARTWRLCGAIYHGYSHFTARYVASNGSVWYHDGANTGSYCV